MDRVDAMRLYARIVERRSFTGAAIDLGLPRSTATEAVKQLEKRLGVRLLDRTTRQVAATPDGDAFYRRCLAILSDVDEAEGAFTDARPRGLLRIEVHGKLFRSLLLPDLPAFLDRHPDLRLQIGEGDRLADIFREGIDCAVRVGPSSGAGLVARHLGTLSEGVFASPAYLERHGVPRTLADLDGHLMVAFLSSHSGEAIPLEFAEGGATRTVTLPHRITAASSETCVALAMLGYGLYQAPRYGFAPDLASGALVEVLRDYAPTPTAVTALFPKNRQLSSRVRVFVEWAAQRLAAALPPDGR